MIQLNKPSTNVKKIVHLIFSSQGRFLQMKIAESMFSEEFTQKQLHQKLMLKSNDQTMLPENQMISKFRIFKEILL